MTFISPLFLTRFLSKGILSLATILAPELPTASKKVAVETHQVLEGTSGESIAPLAEELDGLIGYQKAPFDSIGSEVPDLDQDKELTPEAFLPLFDFSIGEKSPLLNDRKETEIDSLYREETSPHLDNSPQENSEISPIEKEKTVTPSLSSKDSLEKREPDSTSTIDLSVSTPSDKKENLDEPQKYLINLSNVNVAEYIRFISKISGKNFFFSEEDLNFNVTVISEELSSLEEIMAALMNELRIHGLTLMEQGNNIIIHNNPNVNSPPTLVPNPHGTPLPRHVQIVTRVFRLSSLDPAKLKGIIAPLLSTQAIIEILPETGHLILTDLTTNVDQVALLVKTLDSPQAGLEVVQYRPRNLYVDSLAEITRKLITPLTQEGKRIDLIPFLETNSLYIIATPHLIEKTVALLDQVDRGVEFQGESLDKNGVTRLGDKEENSESRPYRPRRGREKFGEKSPSSPPLGEKGGDDGSCLEEDLPVGYLLSTEFDIYKLQYRKGEQIQQALQSIADSLISATLRNGNEGGGSEPSLSVTISSNGSQKELLSAISSVQWIEATNTLVFTGTRGANLKLKQLIRDLDISNEQVLIELLLLDTTLADSLNYGVNFGTRFGGPSIGGAQGFNTSSSPLPSALGQIPTGLVNANSLALAEGFSLGVIGQNIIHCGSAFGSISALVRALHKNQISKVVLNQKIVVEDNQAAEIFVGLNVPFKTQSVANEFGNILTNNFEYRDIGARLKVTPLINKNGIITLQIEQELSTLISSSVISTGSTFADSQSSGPTTRKSNAKTTVFVPDGSFVILSGTIQDETETTKERIPCLGGIPVMGALFGERQTADNKRALMMFLRPSLLNSKKEIQEQTERQQDIFRQKTEEKNLWDYEINHALDYLNLPQSAPMKR